MKPARSDPPPRVSGALPSGFLDRGPRLEIWSKGRGVNEAATVKTVGHKFPFMAPGSTLAPSVSPGLCDTSLPISPLPTTQPSPTLRCQSWNLRQGARLAPSVAWSVRCASGAVVFSRMASTLALWVPAALHSPARLGISFPVSGSCLSRSTPTVNALSSTPSSRTSGGSAVHLSLED